MACSDTPEMKQLFLAADKPALRAAVQYGLPLGASAPVSSKPDERDGGAGAAPFAGGPKIVLFSDAWEAVVVGPKGSAKPAPGTIHALLVCRVCPGRAFTTSAPVCVGCADAGAGGGAGGGGGGNLATPAPDVPASCSCTIAPVDLSEPGVVRTPSSIDSGKGGRGGVGRYACVLRGADAGRVLPEYYVLAAEASPGHHGAGEVTEEALEAAITRITNLWGGLPEGVRARALAPPPPPPPPAVVVCLCAVPQRSRHARVRRRRTPCTLASTARPRRSCPATTTGL